jgi:fibronectin type 3 domain-containing protein
MNTYPACIGFASSHETFCRRVVRAIGRFRILIAVVVFVTGLGFSGCSSISSSSGSNPAVANGLNANPAQANLASAHDVTLNWNASISSGVVGYNVYRGTVSGGPYTKMNSSIVTVTSYNDNAVQSGQTYYYVVTSIDLDYDESWYSSEIVAPIP